LRQPVADWHETRRAALERGAREARSLHRQATAAADRGEAQGEAEGALPTIERACPVLKCLAHPRSTVVAQRAVHVLAELQQFQRDVERGRGATRRDAEWFQPKLAALVAFTGGGVLRPGSVSGLFLRPPPLLSPLVAL
jgi:hypothetical protein